MINSDLFGTSFIRFKQEYLNPLITTVVPQDKTEFWILKNLLGTGRCQFNYNSKNCFSVIFDKEDYYKTLIAEINCFQNKISFQIKELKTKFTSSNWHFVTFYYYSFFNTFQMLLYCHQGYIFIDTEEKREIESILNSVSTGIIQIDKGNYLFTEDFIDTNGMITVKFTKSPNAGGVHQDTWKRFAEILRTKLIPNADANERLIFEQMKNICTYYGEAFPSLTRNYFNYNPLSYNNDLNENITYISQVKENFIDKFLSLDANRLDTLEDKAYVTQFFGIIISSIKEKLYKEYAERNKKINIAFKEIKKIPYMFIE